MKIRKMTPVTSSAERIEVKVEVPTSWQALTDGQLRYICHLLAYGQHSIDEIKSLFFIHLARLSRFPLLKLSPMVIAEHLPLLDWMDTPPDAPVRLSAIDGKPALNACLEGTPFGAYLAINNYYQGFLSSRNREALDELGHLLYPGTQGESFPHDIHHMLLLWMVGLMKHYTTLFPELFRSSAEDGSIPDLREIMNAEIRALTGGDITKQQAVLQADTIDALTELDAKAREARELNERMKS